MMTTTDRLRRRYARQIWEGLTACEAGHPIEANAYDRDFDLNAHLAWRQGWLEAAGRRTK